MNTHLEFDRTLRIAVIRYLVEKGRAPDTHELAADYDASPEHVEASLTRLHEHHGLVLHPHSHRIWLAHPFSTAPTHFFVEPVASNTKAAATNTLPASAATPAGEASSENQFQPRGWWANCD